MKTVGFVVVVLSLSIGVLGDAHGAESMRFEETSGRYLDLLWEGEPLLRFMYEYDPSTSQRRFETYKPFLHVYDGTQRLTNGPDGQSEYVSDRIRYPHHRGIFIGWNRLRFEGKRYDLWHMRDVAQVHQRFEEMAAEADTARCVEVVHWNDPAGETILVEKRSITAQPLAAPAIVLVDFQTELQAVRGDVELNGDPEHAGAQYRAHNDVAAGPVEVKAKYLFHKDGIDPRKDKDLPWVAMTYGLGGKYYTVQHMNHPDNPRGTVYSAYRDYGRFGAFFVHKIEEGRTLKLRYRFVVSRGDAPSREDLAARHTEFVNRGK